MKEILFAISKSWQNDKLATTKRIIISPFFLIAILLSSTMNNVGYYFIKFGQWLQKQAFKIDHY